MLHAGLIGGLGPVIIYGLAIATGGDQLTMRKLTGLALSCAGLASLVAQKGGPAARVMVLGDLIVLAGDRGVLLLHRPPRSESPASTTISRFRCQLQRSLGGAPAIAERSRSTTSPGFSTSMTSRR